MAKFMLILELVCVIVMVHTALGSDPDLTTDFNVTNPNADSFTFRGLGNAQPPGKGLKTANFVTFNTLPGLNGLGLTVVLFEFGPQSQLDPHYHPRATEVFYVLTGQIDVGFVDTANHLFEATLQAGDLFVFPKGMLHWQRNNCDGTGSGFSALSSENAGAIFVAEALFTGGNEGLPEIVLTTAFGSNNWEIDTLRNSVAKISNITLIPVDPPHGQ